MRFPRWLYCITTPCINGPIEINISHWTYSDPACWKTRTWHIETLGM
jgi:hypothetical protein